MISPEEYERQLLDATLECYEGDQRKLAYDMQCTESMISHVRMGRRHFSSSLLRKLAECYGYEGFEDHPSFAASHI